MKKDLKVQLIILILASLGVLEGILCKSYGFAIISGIIGFVALLSCFDFNQPTTKEK